MGLALSGDFDGPAHAPVIGAAPTGTVKGVFPGCVKGQGRFDEFTRKNIQRRPVGLANRKTMHHIITGQAQMNRLPNLCLDRINAPAAVLWHARVQLDCRCLILGQPPAAQWNRRPRASTRRTTIQRASVSFFIDLTYQQPEHGQRE